MKEKTALSRSEIRCVLLFTAAFSLLARGYRDLSLRFSGDATLLSQVREEAYQISLERFLQPVYWQIRGYITAPLHIAPACGMLTANETLAVSNATDLPWTDVYMLALLLSLLGVYAFVTMRCPYCALYETGNCRYLEMALDEPINLVSYEEHIRPSVSGHRKPARLPGRGLLHIHRRNAGHPALVTA